MARFIAAARAFAHHDEGVSLVEYALTLLLILMVTVGAISAFGSKMSAFFSNLGSSL
jgi:Flp pilus assembly pilin Flp